MLDLGSLSLRSDKYACSGKLAWYLSRGLTASQRTGIWPRTFSELPAGSGLSKAWAQEHLLLIGQGAKPDLCLPRGCLQGAGRL